jgi:hypothetical protein
MTVYDQALQQLYQAPVANFLNERKRLAAELRAQGDEAGAAQVAKRPKPVASVWAVNQLYWQEREAFDEMLAAAARLRQGDRGATKAYHNAIANLRRRAAIILNGAGYAASEVTLRRAATTLAAIGAAGSFAPDPPGALAADRDPPGFEAVSLLAQAVSSEQHTPPMHGPTGPSMRPRDERAGRVRANSDSASDPAAREPASVRARLRAAEAMERERQEVERARRKAERARLQGALRAATAEVRTREREIALLEKQLRDAGQAVSDARATIKDLERRLAELDEED